MFPDKFSTSLSNNTFYSRPDLLADRSQGKLPADTNAKRLAAFAQLPRAQWQATLSQLAKLNSATSNGFCIKDGVVSAGPKIIEPEQKIILQAVIEQILPWRKGPWEIAGEPIDAEWRSDIKYDQLSAIHSSFRGKTILDIGSGNGYYGARMIEHGADCVICLDPSERAFLQLELFQKYARCENLQLDLLGYQDAAQLGILFDIVLCMGIFYHQRDPMGVIEICYRTLKPGGMLILETMTYPSDQPILFFPPERYAKARNVFFLPSVQALTAICHRSGFKEIELLSERTITVDEQRRTRLAPYESLVDFLDPNDRSKTVEGLPAPQRAVLLLKK